MNYFAPGKFRVTLRCALTLIAVITAANVDAQSLRVTAANSSSPNAVYDVFFSPAQTTLLNADGATFKSFHSLVFVANAASGGADLLVADTAGGSIVRYFGPTGTPPVSATVVWSGASNIPGPKQPDGLSVDAKGNLYVVATGNNGAKPQLWVLPATPITAAAPTGFLAPVLLDEYFNGNEDDSLVETLVVPKPATPAAQAALTKAGIGVGDVLVLVTESDSHNQYGESGHGYGDHDHNGDRDSGDHDGYGDHGSSNDHSDHDGYGDHGSSNDHSDHGGYNDHDGRGDHDKHDRGARELVYVYPAAQIQKVINGTAKSVSPRIVSSLCQFPYASGAKPNGMDIWPIDGTLLISTSAGTILQLTLGTSNAATTFASIACTAGHCPFNKLRTGTQGDNAYAFVTQATTIDSGDVLQFAVPMSTATPYGGFRFTAPTASQAASGPTAGAPEGLAVAPESLVVVASSSQCTSDAGCNPTGALGHVIAGPAANQVTGNIFEQTCLITDTRLQAGGACPGTINISQVCPGFAANIIPSTICGASGPAGNQFAAIQTIANGVDNVPGILVQTQETPSAIIPGTTDPACKQQVVGWTTRLGSTEGTEPEGSSLIDMTGYCDGGGSQTKGNSMWLVGGKLSPTVSATKPELVGFTNQKLANLGKMVEGATIAKPAKTALQICLIVDALLLDTGNFACAARATYDCDQIVANTQKSYGSSPANPNPYGDARGRLGSIFFTINSRILPNTPNTIWPLTSPPKSCESKY
jgi:hypothetical protein